MRYEKLIVVCLILVWCIFPLVTNAGFFYDAGGVGEEKSDVSLKRWVVNDGDGDEKVINIPKGKMKEYLSNLGASDTKSNRLSSDDFNPPEHEEIIYLNKGKTSDNEIDVSNPLYKYVKDPTNLTDGYVVKNDVSEGLIELNESRDQTSRHWYNATDGSFVYQSDYFVLSEGEWKTLEEYPVVFVLKLVNGSVYRFNDPVDYPNVANETVVSIAIDGFLGISSFVMDNHGQYQFYPRLKNGSVSESPFYEWFASFYGKKDGFYSDFFVNNHNQFTNDPRDFVGLERDGEIYKLYYDVGVDAINETFNFRVGIKYNITEGYFHAINFVECVTSDFEDIGFAYEFDSDPDFIVRVFDGVTVEFPSTDVWSNESISEYASKVELLNSEGESYIFEFNDMDEAGFTDKYLDSDYRILPTGVNKTVLRVGMYGYGKYSIGSVIEIDPTYGPVATTDTYDWWASEIDVEWTEHTNGDYMEAGYGSLNREYRAISGWDTGITETDHECTSASLALTTSTNSLEAGEYLGVKLLKHYTSTPNEGTGSPHVYFGTLNVYGGEDWDGDTTTLTMTTECEYWITNKGANDFCRFRWEPGTGCDANTQDSVRFWESTYGTAASRAKLTIVHQTTNTAPVANVYTQIPSMLYADKPFTLVTDHTDIDGATDIVNCYGAIGDANNDIQFYVVGAGTSVTMIAGSGYVLSVSCGSTGITNGYRKTWTIDLDWDWDHDEQTVADSFAYTTDGSANSGWDTEDTNAGYENNMEVMLLDVAIDGSAEYGGIDGKIEDTDWFRGGVQVTATGSIEYEGSSQTYDSSYGGVGVGLSYDGADTGIEDITIVAGAFSMLYTPTSATGIDTTAYFDAFLKDEPTGVDVTAAGIEITSKRDNQNPTFDSWAQDADGDSGADGYAPNTNYEDDSTTQGDFSGCSDGSGCGINNYRIKYETGSWGSGDSDGLNVVCTIVAGWNDIYYSIRDNVGNELTGDTTDNIFYGTTDPTGFDTDVTGADGYPVDYVYTYDPNDMTYETIKVNTGETDSWSFTVDADGDANWQSGGAWKVVFEGDWGAAEKTDTTVPYTSNSYLTTGSQGQYISIDIVNNCGERQRLVIPIMVDITEPVTTFYSIVENAPHTYIYYPGSNQEVWFGNGMGVTPQLFTVWVEATDISNIAFVQFDSWGDNPEVNDSSAFYKEQYEVTDNEVTGSFNIFAYDKVGNYDTTPVIITMTEDTLCSISIDTSSTTESSNYLYYAGGTIGYYSDNMGGTLTDFYVYLTGSVGTSGLASLVDNTAFGNDPTYAGSYYFLYQIDSDDSASGNVEVTYTLTDNVGNVDDFPFDFIVDNTAPSVTGTTFLHTDSNSGTGYDPQNGYDDDLVGDYAIGGTTPTEYGSGLPTNRYRYQWNAGGYGSWTSSSSYPATLVDGQSADADMQVVDNVYNYATVDGEDIIVDDDAPVTFTITFSRHTGYSNGYYCYLTGTTIYFNSGETDYFTVQTNDDGSIQNSGFWKVVWDINSVFETVSHDTSGLPDTKNFNYVSDSGGSFIIRLVNNAGNYQEFTTYTATDDIIDPTTTFSSIVENAPHTYIYYPGSNQEVWFGNGMGVTPQLFTVNVTASDGGSSLLYIRFNSWGDNGQVNDTASPYAEQYEITDNEVTGTFNVFAYDKVGNYDATPITITMTEDTVCSLSIDTSSTTESSNYLYYAGGVIYGYYSDNMGGTLTDFDVYLTASIGSSGLASLVDNTAFGNDPTYAGSYYFKYQIDSGDSASGNVEVTYTLTDNVANTDNCIFTFNEDNTNPSVAGTTFLHTDSNSGTGYDPQNGYDDDLVGDYSVGGTTPTDGGSGLPTNRYRYQWNSGGYGSWTSSTSYPATTVDGQSADADMQVVDNVYNIASVDGEDIIVDDDAPITFTITFSRHTGYSNGYYCYLTGTTIYFNSGETDYFTVQTNDDGTIQNSGFWKVVWDVNSVFETVEHDTSGLPDTKNFNYLSDSGGSFVIRLVNNAGNYQEFTTYTATDDITDPTTIFSSIVENAPHTYIYYPGSNQEVWFGNGMGVTPQLFTVTVTASDGAGCGILYNKFGSWGDNSEVDDSSDPYFEQYEVTDNEVTGSFDVTAYDKVGNKDLTPITIIMTEDATCNLTVDTSSTTESSNYLHYPGGVIYGYYSDNMGGTLTDFYVYLTASFGDSGFASLVDNTDFGNNPVHAGSYYFKYQIDSGDSASGNVEVTYTLTDNVGNADDCVFTFNEDNTNPSGVSLALTADVNTGTGYNPNTGYYDDDSVDIDATDKGSITETGSGLQTNCYSFRRDAESWTSYQSGDTYIFTSTTDGDHTMYVKVIDNCDNVITAGFPSCSVTVDVDAPASFTITFSRHTGYGDGYHCYLTGTTIYFNSGKTDYFTVQTNDDGTIQNSNFWKVVWDINSVFETIDHDTSGLPDTKNFNYLSDSGGSFIIRLVNNAGNYQEFTTYTATEDITDPTTTFSSIVENTPHTYIYYQGSGQEVWFSNKMVTTAQLFTVTVTANDGGSSLLYIRFNSWGDNGQVNDAASPYTEQYEVTDNEVTGSFNVIAYDKVGNYDATPIVITMTEDITDPTTTFSSIVENAPHTYIYYPGSNQEVWFGNGMITTAQLFTVTVTADDGAGAGIYSVRFYSWGDNSEVNDMASPYTEQYEVTDNEVTGSFNIRSYDKVGNYDVTPITITMTEDLVCSLSINTSSTTESSNYLYYAGGVIYGYYSDNMGGTLTDFDVYLTGSIGTSGFASLVDNTAFGNNPTYMGSYYFKYQIDSGDSASGNVEVTYTLTDNVANTDDCVFTFYEDNTNPVIIGTTFLHADSNSGAGYEPVNGYDDDLVGDYTVGGTTPTDASSGLPTNRYRYQWNAGGYGSWTSSNTYQATMIDDQSADADMQVVDNVYNIASVDGEDIIVDDDAPIIFTITFSRHTGYSDGYHCYLTGTTIYFNSGETDYFTVQINNDGTIQNSGFWKVVWDINSVFETIDHDTSGLPDTKNFNYLSDSGGSFIIRLVNNAGNYQEFTIYTATDDISNPQTTFSSIVEGFPNTYIYYPGSGQEVWFSDGMGGTVNPFNVTVTVNDGSGSGVMLVWFDSWGDNTQVNDTTSVYERKYEVTSNEVSGTIDIKAIDWVGNVDASPIVITLTEDTDQEITVQIDIDNTTENSNYLYYDGTSSYGYYSNNMGIASDHNFTVHLNVTDGGGSGLASLVDDTNFGNNPIYQNSSLVWYWLEYEIDSGDSGYGTFTVTFNATDNVGNWDTCTFQFRYDVTPPTTSGMTLTHSDSNSGSGYDPNNGYDDDTTGYYTLTGSPVDSDAGLPTLMYRYRWNDGTWGNWVVDTTYNAAMSDGQSADTDVEIRDNVGNTVIFDGEDVVCDVDSPSGYTITVTRDTGYPNYHAYDNGTHILFSSDYNDYVIATANDVGSSGGSGVWKVRVDENGVFEIASFNESALPQYNHLNYQSDTTGTIVLRVVNNAGNYQEITFEVVVDITYPTTTFSSLIENAPHTYIYYNDSDVTVYFSDNMGSTDQLFTVTVTFSDVGSGTYGVYFSTWDDDGGSTVEGSSPLGLQYSTDSSEGSGTISIYACDKVGNYDASPVIITMTEDTTSPSFVSWIVTETSGFLFNDTVSGDDYIWYGDGMSGSETLVIGANGSDSQSGVEGINFPTYWGTNYFYDVSYPYSHSYSIENTDTDSGYFDLTCFDNVWNTITKRFYVVRDLTHPTISISTSLCNESSEWLYYDGTSMYGWYSDNMEGSTVTFNVGGVASDPTYTTNAGIYEVRDNTTFGNDPSNYTFSSNFWNEQNWAFAYQIDSGDSSGDFWINFTIVDRVGNEAYCTFEFKEDNVDPDPFSVYSPVYENDDGEVRVNATSVNDGRCGIRNTDTYEWWINVTRDIGEYWTVVSNYNWTGLTNDANQTFYCSVYDNCGNYANATTNVTICDFSAPIGDFDLFQDIFALVNGYYSGTTVYTNISGESDVGNAGLADNYLAYKTDSDSWGAWTDVVDLSRVCTDQYNSSLYVKIRDKAGNEQELTTIWVIVDTISPILGWLTLDEMYSPNWYDQNKVSTANVQIYFTELYPHNITMGCSLPSTNDTLPVGSVVYLTVTISGAADGTYSLNITIWDRAGNSDTTLAGSEAPIQLDAGMYETDPEDWIYLNYYDHNGYLMHFDNFRTFYVIDEDYKNYTEISLYFNQIYVNTTSIIRFITKNVFNQTIYNQSMSVPSNRFFYLVLNIYTLKFSNIADYVINVTLMDDSTSYSVDEQIMPNEIFAFHLYEGYYNITAYRHSSGAIIVDGDGNTLTNYQVNMVCDQAIFIMTNVFKLEFEYITIGDEIASYTVDTNQEVTSVTVYLMLNGSCIEFPDGSYSTIPGVIIFSRPTYGYYNFSRVFTYMGVNYTKSTWITVTSNAIITNFVLSGTADDFSYIYISWNTNKGTGVLTIYDNSSAVMVSSLEGQSVLEKSVTVGIHVLTFEITVESRTFSFSANYTIDEWTAIVTLTASVYGSVGVSETIVVAVERSDGETMTGTVLFSDGTSVSIISGRGAFTTVLRATGIVTFTVAAVLDGSASTHEYVANTATIIFDKNYARLDLINDPAKDGYALISINITSMYDNRIVTSYSYEVQISKDGGVYTRYASYTEIPSFTLENLPPGSYSVKLATVYNLDDGVTTSKTDLVMFTISDTALEEVISAETAMVVLLAIIGVSVAGAMLRKWLIERNKKLSSNSKSKKSVFEKKNNRWR